MAKSKSKQTKKAPQAPERLDRTSYLYSMSHAIDPDKSVHSLQLLPAMLFTSFVILIVHQFKYVRADMSTYYWSGGQTNLNDFFSYYKSVAIEDITVLMILFLLYRFVTQSLAVKRSVFYIPMGIYLFFVLLSFFFSEKQYVAWNGWNDRFEGTFVIICYILMLFYIINSVNSERNLKWMLYSLAGVTIVLSTLGVSQALGRDFFQTALGQKLLVPNKTLDDGQTVWDAIDKTVASGEDYLVFEFKNREIYQTVYNINYVSFYLTLLLPIFALLFIREKHFVKKTIWGLIFALLVFNLIGSSSSSGLMGSAVIVVIAVILLNKRLLRWRKSIVILVAVTVVVGGFTFDRWSSELTQAFKGVFGNATAQAADLPEEIPADKAGASGHKIDYFITNAKGLTFSLDGSAATFSIAPGGKLVLTDASGEDIALSQDADSGDITPVDERFEDAYIFLAQNAKKDEFLVFALRGEEKQWRFLIRSDVDNRLIFQNDFERTVDLIDVPHWGFKNNPGFGNGRGYIWSASLPMLKDTLLIGKGADTYCIYFPHRDYVTKYNSGFNANLIVDKPHNMYIGIAFNTGLISLIALLSLFGIYIVQSFRLYRRDSFDTFASFAGAGIFLGICGFLTAATVNDSTVSVMPMFYGLLGTGIAANMIVKRRRTAEE
jgi:hypothetical protein